MMDWLRKWLTIASGSTAPVRLEKGGRGHQKVPESASAPVFPVTTSDFASMAISV